VIPLPICDLHTKVISCINEAVLRLGLLKLMGMLEDVQH